MWSKRFLTLFLALLLALPAFCGWDAFKSSSTGVSGTEARDSITTTEPLEMSSKEEPSGTSQTLEPLKSYEESSGSYDATLTEIGRIIDEKKASDAIEEITPMVDDLISSKEVMQENYLVVKQTLQEQEEYINHLENELDGANFAIGVSMGYSYPLTFSPGIDMQMRGGDWIFSIGVSYSVDATRGLHDIRDIDPRRIETRVGIMYEF